MISNICFQKINTKGKKSIRMTCSAMIGQLSTLNLGEVWKEHGIIR